MATMSYEEYKENAYGKDAAAFGSAMANGVNAAQENWGNWKASVEDFLGDTKDSLTKYAETTIAGVSDKVQHAEYFAKASAEYGAIAVGNKVNESVIAPINYKVEMTKENIENKVELVSDKVEHAKYFAKATADYAKDYAGAKITETKETVAKKTVTGIDKGVATVADKVAGVQDGIADKLQGAANLLQGAADKTADNAQANHATATAASSHAARVNAAESVAPTATSAEGPSFQAGS